MKNLLPVIFTLLCVASPIAGNSHAAGKDPSSQSPNIVYILVGGMGYGDVSALNPDAKFKTPFIDQLAAEGMIFVDAHTSSSVCTPTRYNVLTGRYNWRTDLKEFVLNGYGKPLIDEERLTLASLCRDAGYQTAMIGKWHLGMGLPICEPNVDEPTLPDKNEYVDWSKKITRTPTSNGFDYFRGLGASLDFPPYVYIENDRYTSQNIPSSQSQKCIWMQMKRNAGFIRKLRL